MKARFFDRFKRITYSTAYLPELDGLRFLAILSVVAIMHTSHFLDEKFYGNGLAAGGYWKNFIMEGGNGVGLFFAISGFILSLPFARWRLAGQKKVLLGTYFLRRVTRLEPPYILVLLVLFAAEVWGLHKYTASVLLPHLLASVFYVHTLVFHSFSWVLPVSWSLEVEVQFYILAPVFCLSFLIRRPWVRRSLYVLVMLASSICWFGDWHSVHVLHYLHFFFAGILAADLYVSKAMLFPAVRVRNVAGLLALAGFLFIPSIHYMPGYLLKTLCMFLLLHTVSTSPLMKKIFSVSGLVLIGGMCYSIYLLHFAILSVSGMALQHWGLASPARAAFFPLAFLLLLAVLLLSALYFIAVEKPFMKPPRRGYPKKAEAKTPIN